MRTRRQQTYSQSQEHLPCQAETGGAHPARRWKGGPSRGDGAAAFTVAEPRIHSRSHTAAVTQLQSHSCSHTAASTAAVTAAGTQLQSHSRTDWHRGSRGHRERAPPCTSGSRRPVSRSDSTSLAVHGSAAPPPPPASGDPRCGELGTAPLPTPLPLRGVRGLTDASTSGANGEPRPSESPGLAKALPPKLGLPMGRADGERSAAGECDEATTDDLAEPPVERLPPPPRPPAMAWLVRELVPSAI